MLENFQQDPHANARIIRAGSNLQEARSVLILLHGRGASANHMLSLFTELALPEVHAVAAEANGNSWYPHTFLAEIEDNQPYLDSALLLVKNIITDLKNSGISDSRIFLLGFSQGACLASEFVARNTSRYAGLIALTGGLIGKDLETEKYKGDLAGTPVFIGTSNPDPHVPLQRVKESASVFKKLGAKVDLRIYPGMPHSINEEEIIAVRKIIKS